jgi:hypothetical protein
VEASRETVENTDDQEAGPAYPSDVEHPVCIIDQLITVTMEILEHYETVRTAGNPGRGLFLASERAAFLPALSFRCSSHMHSRSNLDFSE